MNFRELVKVIGQPSDSEVLAVIEHSIMGLIYCSIKFKRLKSGQFSTKKINIAFGQNTTANLKLRKVISNKFPSKEMDVSIEKILDVRKMTTAEKTREWQKTLKRINDIKTIHDYHRFKKRR